MKTYLTVISHQYSTSTRMVVRDRIISTKCYIAPRNCYSSIGVVPENVIAGDICYGRHDSNGSIKIISSIYTNESKTSCSFNPPLVPELKNKLTDSILFSVESLVFIPQTSDVAMPAVKV